MPTKSEIRERIRLIRNATPDCLESLYEMQNRRCDLCEHPIQDLVCAALDHSTPIVVFARSYMSIEEAIRQCNDLKNLRAAHFSCNSAKNGLTREEWFAQGPNDRAMPRLLTEGQLRKLCNQLKKSGRKGGFEAARRWRALLVREQVDVCGHVVQPAANGVSRGICTLRPSHKGKHGNKTCAQCAKPVSRGNAYCRPCRKLYAQNYRDATSEAVAQLYDERQRLQAIAGPLLVEQMLNRICAEQSAAV